MACSLSRLALGLALILICGSIELVRAQSIGVSTLSVPQGVNDLVWDGTRSRFFASSGKAVLIINPETAQIEDTIQIGSPVNRLAVSADGKYLYVALGGSFVGDSLGIVNRYQIEDHTLAGQIALGQYTGVTAMAVLPDQPLSLLVATNDRHLAAFDGSVRRPGILTLSVSSLYVRPSDGTIFGIADDAQYPDIHPQIFRFMATSAGVTVEKSVPVDLQWTNASTVTWNGNLVVSRNPFASYAFDLSAGTTIGRIPQSSAVIDACFLAADASGASAIAYHYGYRSGAASITRLVQYSLLNLTPTASIDLTGIPQNDNSVAGPCRGSALTWGADGLLIHGDGGDLFFLHAAALPLLPPAPVPSPTQDTSGVIHLALPANGLAYDSGRNLLWASIPGTAAALGNSVVSIDPGTGNIVDTISAGSEPSTLALSADGSHLFAALGGAPAVASIDLSTKQSSVFSVLDPSNSLYWSAIGLSAISGQSNSLIAVRSAPGGPHSSIVAYDAGVARKNMFNNGTGSGLYSQYAQTVSSADSANTFYAADTALHYGDGTHDVWRLVVDSTGVRLDKQLNNLLLGSGSAAGATTGYAQPVSLVYDGGRLFTSAGQMFKPDTTRILGSIALTPAYGLPVPLTDQNGVVYVQSYSPQVSATFYDFGTLTPILSLPLLTGPPCGCTTSVPSAVNVTAAVRAGSSTIAIAANGEIVIARLASFQPWPSSTGQVQRVSTGVQQIDMSANAISVLPGTSKLLLATPSRVGTMGNSIVTFNSDTQQVESAAFIGSEPSVVAASPRGSAIYAYLSGEYDLARLNVAAGSRDLVFAADPTGGFDQQYGVFDMAISPDGGLAVSSLNPFIGLLGGFDQTRPGQFIGIFDNGVLRPQIDTNSQGAFANGPATFALAFDDTGARLYAYNSFLSSFQLKRDAVSSLGVQWLSTKGELIGGYGATIRYARGLLYSSNGWVVDPEQSIVVDRFTDSWLPGTGAAVAPDPDGGRVYFATFSGILVFDINTRALLGRLPIDLGSNIFDSPKDLVRLGADGLAFVTATGRVYLVSISAIPLLPTPPASTSQQVTTSAGGAATRSTLGPTGTLQVGYAVASVDSGSAPYATAVMTVIQNGVVVSEVGVPSSPPTTSARIFVEERSNVVLSFSPAGVVNVKTGVAIVNPAATSSTVTYTLRGYSGETIAVGHAVVPGLAHQSWFIDELQQYANDFILPSDFDTATGFATLEISSNSSLSVVALRLTVNQRNETLLTTVPIVDLTQSAVSVPMVFPQFVDGGGYRTGLYLLNTTSSAENGTIRFFDNDGNPLSLRIENGTTSSSQFSYAIAAGGFMTLFSNGSSAIANVGSIQVIADSGYNTPVGAGIFSSVQNGILVTESAISSAEPTTHARIFIDKTKRHSVGLALANSNASAVTVTLQAFQSDGTTPVGSTTLSLPANGHQAKFDSELIPMPAAFVGVLDISSPSPVSALTLRFLVNSRNDFLLTTLPVADFTRPAPTPIIFPQITDGGGYQTEFILINAGVGGQTTLRLFDQKGAPLPVGGP